MGNEFCLATIGAERFSVRWLRLAHFLFQGGKLIWQTTRFVELIAIPANSKRNKIAKVVKRLREKYFGASVTSINAMPKKIKSIAENVLNSLATHSNNGQRPKTQKESTI